MNSVKSKSRTHRVARRRRVLDRSYLALLRQFPLKPIKYERDYEAAGRVLDDLVLRPTLDRGERDYLGALEVLIEAYDDRNFPETPDARPPHERLRYLMASSGTSPSDLQRILGTSQPLVSLMLSGERSLSKQTIAKLGAHFRVAAGYFL